MEALLSGAQWQKQRQWAEMETQEVLCEHQETLGGWWSNGTGCPERWWSLCQTVWVTLLGAAGPGPASLQRSLPAPPFCDMDIWCMWKPNCASS